MRDYWVGRGVVVVNGLLLAANVIVSCSRDTKVAVAQSPQQARPPEYGVVEACNNNLDQLTDRMNAAVPAGWRAVNLALAVNPIGAPCAMILVSR